MKLASPAALLLLIGQPLVFYRHVLFRPRTHIPFDLQGFHLPLAASIARSVRDGVLPFWDPYSYCGVPIHADVQAQLFYPVTWLALLAGNLSAGRDLFYWYQWLVPLHMMLAGGFAFLLLRAMGTAVPVALFGATVYQLGGFFASQAQHLGAICCGAWLPLVLLCVWKLHGGGSRRWIGLLAVGAALTILSGYPAASATVFIAAALLMLALAIAGRSNWTTVAAVVAGLFLGAGISAVQLVPTSLLAPLSVASSRSQIDGLGGGLPLQSLMSLLVPDYYHIFSPFDRTLFTLPYNFTFLYAYCGLAALVLLVVAPLLRRAPLVKMFLALTIVAALWMLGEATPVYRVFYTHLPRVMRGPLYAEMALAAFGLFFALTAALALEHVRGSTPLAIVWGLALFAAADLIHFGSERPMNTMPGSYEESSSEYRVEGAPRAIEKIGGLLHAANPPVRVDYVGRDLLAAVTGATLFRFPTCNGDNPLALQRILALRRAFGRGHPWDRQLPVDRPASPLLTMLNVGFLMAPLGAENIVGWPVAAELRSIRVFRNPNVLPRFFLARRVHRSSGIAESLSRLTDGAFQPAVEAVVESDDIPAGDLPGDGDIRVVRYSPNDVELTVEATGRVFLASSETMYPGWRATVNGRETTLHMTNGAFRGLLLEQGTNHVSMRYWPVGLTAGAGISVACVLLAGAAVMRRRDTTLL